MYSCKHILQTASIALKYTHNANVTHNELFCYIDLAITKLILSLRHLLLSRKPNI